MSDPKPSLEQLEMHEDFVRRHIGPDEQSLQQMLAALNLSSLDDLVNKTVPAAILSKRPRDLAPARGERATGTYLRHMRHRNQVFTSMIGCG